MAAWNNFIHALLNQLHRAVY